MKTDDGIKAQQHILENDYIPPVTYRDFFFQGSTGTQNLTTSFATVTYATPVGGMNQATSGSWVLSGGEITVPATGKYRIFFSTQVTTNNTSVVNAARFRLQVNGVSLAPESGQESLIWSGTWYGSSPTSTRNQVFSFSRTVEITNTAHKIRIQAIEDGNTTQIAQILRARIFIVRVPVFYSGVLHSGRSSLGFFSDNQTVDLQVLSGSSPVAEFSDGAVLNENSGLSGLTCATAGNYFLCLDAAAVMDFVTNSIDVYLVKNSVEVSGSRVTLGIDRLEIQGKSGFNLQWVLPLQVGDTIGFKCFIGSVSLVRNMTLTELRFTSYRLPA